MKKYLALLLSFFLVIPAPVRAEQTNFPLAPAAESGRISVVLSHAEGVIYGTPLVLSAETDLEEVFWEEKTEDGTFVPTGDGGKTLTLRHVVESGEYRAAAKSGEETVYSPSVAALIAPRPVRAEFSYEKQKENGKPVLPQCAVLGVLEGDDPCLVLEPDSEPVKKGEYTVTAYLLSPDYTLDGPASFTYRIAAKFPWRDVLCGAAVALLAGILFLRVYLKKRREKKDK